MKFTFLHCILLIALTAATIAGNAQDCEVGVMTTSTGNWANEMSWELYAYDNQTLEASFQGGQNYAIEELAVCLEAGCYFFVMNDSWGDGWNGGDVELSMESGVIFEFALSEGFLAYGTFEIGETEACDYALAGCTNPIAVNFVEGATEDDGSCFVPESFFTSGDDERTYFLHIPENVSANAPLVFALHGHSGSAPSMAAFSGMSEIADSEGFVVCYPQGLPDFGNITHWNANLGISNVNDIQFLTELALYLQTSLDLSSDCTYSCGYSNGGYMSYSLACAMPDVFKAIGSVGGTMSGEAWETCEAQAVPVVHIHGTADGVVPYGSTLGSNDPWDGAPDVETVVAHWANANGCTEVTTTSLPDLDPSDGSTVDLIEHSGSPTGYKAQVYRVNGGGHDWFGTWGNMDIESSAAMWSFWSSFCESPLSVAEPVLPIQFQQPHLCSTQSNVLVAHEDIRLTSFDSSGRLVASKLLFANQSWEMAGSGLRLVVARSNSGQTQQLKVVLTD